MLTQRVVSRQYMVCTAYDMNPEMEKYFATNKYLLKRVGAWPYQHKILKVLIPSLIVMVHNSTVITQVMYRIN